MVDPVGFKPTCFYTEGESRITGPENFFIKDRFFSLHFLKKNPSIVNIKSKKGYD